MDEASEREFSQFVHARGAALLRVAYALTGEQHAAEDLLQTALAKTMLRWSKINGDAEPYVRRVLYHEHISWWRRRWRRAESTVADLPEPAMSGHPDIAAETGDRLHVRAALAGLPPRQRAVLVLRYLEDLSVGQVAELLGCSEGTVASQTHRALVTLRRRMPTGDGNDVRGVLR